MICPQCKSKRTRVLETAQFVGQTNRYITCDGCGITYHTTEVIVIPTKEELCYWDHMFVTRHKVTDCPIVIK